MFRIGAVALVGVALLAACETRPLNELTYAEQQEMIVKLTANCAAAGVTTKSPKYETCMQAEINAENAKRVNNREGIRALGDGMAEAGDNYSAAARANRPMTCTTNRGIGYGSSTTTCY